ncbi:MAG: hypothetical protein PF495_16525 [Spirochaetales bacterium]|jgi:hypothetical protein|nr:hypothetical protein [Spirochaetales bacterium]
MSVIDTIFSWFDRTTQTNPTKQDRRDPNSINRTEPMVVNRALTKGLYHNQYPNMRLAGALAYNPIAVPVWFMGLPIPKSDNESEQELLKEIMDRFAQVCKQIHIETHRDGTVWAWPFFSARDRQLHWELIPDESVIRIIKDLETGYPI